VDCYGLRDDPAGIDKCTLFAGGARGTIAVIGDSHAREWLPAITWMAQQDGWTVIPLLKMGCWPSAYDDACGTYIAWAEQEVRVLHPDVVLIGGELRFNTPRAIQQSAGGISMLAGALKPFAQHVMVIGDPPHLTESPGDCLPARDATLAKCTSRLAPVQVSLYEDAARAASSSGAQFLDTLGWFCFESQCPMVIGHVVTYREDDHISMTYATALKELFRAAFVHALSE
jgi:hypothetical protein